MFMKVQRKTCNFEGQSVSLQLTITKGGNTIGKSRNYVFSIQLHDTFNYIVLFVCVFVIFRIFSFGEGEGANDVQASAVM